MGAMREIASDPRQYYCGMMKLKACRSISGLAQTFFACFPILLFMLGRCPGCFACHNITHGTRVPLAGRKAGCVQRVAHPERRPTVA